MLRCPPVSKSNHVVPMQEHESAGADTVIERALQGYAPEDVRQAAELVSGLMSVLPLDLPLDLSSEQGRRGSEPELAG